MDGRRTPVPRRGALRTAAGALLAGASAAGCARDTPPRPPSKPGSADSSPDGPGAHKAHGAVAPAAVPRRFPGQPVQIEHGPRGRPRVALTFHGQGDPVLARAVLGEAERAGARLTVLAVGGWLDQNPGMARRILDGGHDLGNHTQSHLDINTMDEERAFEEIAGCARRLRRLTGSIGTWFRPSRARYATPSSRTSPGVPGIRTSCPTTWTPSTSPRPGSPPSPARSPASSATVPW